MLQTMPDQPYELAGQLRGMAHHFLGLHLVLDGLLLLGLSRAAFDSFLAQEDPNRVRSWGLGLTGGPDGERGI